MAKAIGAIVTNYKRNRTNVINAHNIATGKPKDEGVDNPETHAHLLVGMTTSDSEAAIVNTCIQDLGKEGINTKTMPSGEHVTFVERSMQSAPASRTKWIPLWSHIW